GVISGSGNLAKVGGGILTLSGANTFTGDTKITDGNLILGHTLALQNSSLDYSSSYAGALSFGTQAATTFGGLKGNQSLALTNASAGNVALTIGNNNSNAAYTG